MSSTAQLLDTSQRTKLIKKEVIMNYTPGISSIKIILLVNYIPCEYGELIRLHMHSYHKTALDWEILFTNKIHKCP